MATQRSRDPARGQELPALTFAVLTVIVLAALIYVGSGGLDDFDSALIGYAVGTVVAVAGLVYRYTLWITRPPTWRYFKAGWAEFFSWRNFRRYTLLVPKAWWTDIFGQTFVFRRSATRWLMHMCIFWGVLLSVLITVPLTFGWIKFTFVQPEEYKIWFFQVPLFTFPLGTVVSWLIFHALNISAVVLLIGVSIALWRRTTDAGMLSVQSFVFDLMPLILLFTIAVTGLALTASVTLWEGSYYWFISLVHQLVVVVWLVSLPFGKFFHIVERPATIGVTLYRTVSDDREHEAGLGAAGACRRCGEPLPSHQFVVDLRETLAELGQDYDLGDDRGYLQEYCPSCKRILRGQAYYELMGRQFL